MLTNFLPYYILVGNEEGRRTGAGNSNNFNTDAMNGINLMNVFQRAAGWCEVVYLVKCLTREQKTLSGYVIFRIRNGERRNSISIRVVPRKLMPSSLSLRRRLFLNKLGKCGSCSVQFLRTLI